MILALELCEEIVVYGMVSDSYCRSGRPARGRGGAGEAGSFGTWGVWVSGWVAEAGTPPLSWCPGARGPACGTGSMPVSTLPKWP